jgi:hypothetical protein
MFFKLFFDPPCVLALAWTLDFLKIRCAVIFEALTSLLAVGCDDALRAVRLPRSSSFRVLLFAWIQSIEGLTF